MTNRHQQLADKVVHAFRATLDEDTRGRISDAQFEALRRLVADALSEELQTTTDRLDTLVQDLRTELERPELEL